MSANTERTINLLTKQKAYCDIVERFIHQAGVLKFSYVNGKRMGKHMGVRKDLFGIIDIIAIYSDRQRLVGIQSCGTDFSEHKKKILENFFSPLWLKCADLELWGWRKLKTGKSKEWIPRIHKFTLVDFL